MAQRSQKVPTGPERLDEFEEKRRRLRGLIRRLSLKGILLSNRSNFSWLTCGGASHVRSDSEKGLASLWVTEKKVELWCDNIEAPRLKAEQTVGLPIKSRVHPWVDSKSWAKFPSKSVSDDGHFDLKAIPDEITALRASLTAPERNRYRLVGALSVSAMESVAFRVRKGWTERQVASELSREIIARGLEPTVLLIGSDERINRFRHPLPTDRKINHCAMLVVCAKGFGLVASLTRMIHFGAVPTSLKKRHQACLSVECAMWAASNVGAPAGEIFKSAQAEYAKQGFPGEWKKHHQGGPAGYDPRDYLARPGEKRRLVDHQALAWNPSITGTKSEDTVLLSGSGLEVLTQSRRWPLLKVRYGGKEYERPDILKR